MNILKIKRVPYNNRMSGSRICSKEIYEQELNAYLTNHTGTDEAYIEIKNGKESMAAKIISITDDYIEVEADSQFEEEIRQYINQSYDVSMSIRTIAQ